ncbi:sigma 54-interacting transcriptional regulator [Aliikangiella coralliicola]|uniref:Response regulator n=1 Tax=Aliikangiella coralliicola TaxID=2592383 RepID=A0A545UGY7_9GAMM|nr:sigma 54-interacting transcriptional regulator [Aliikangiella coralliicola]TQV88731.1 response regulator [Aliikangiella coralliicola]
MNAHILLVDDDPSLLKLLSLRIESAGYQVTTADSAQVALDFLKSNNVDLVITDLKMEPMDGMELQQQIQIKYPSIPVIMLTAHGSIPDAVTATKRGIFTFLTKPVDKESLFENIEKAIAIHGGADHRSSYSHENSSGILTRSRTMLHLLDQVKKLANTDVNILITGESGTGKELLAQAIHQHRREKDAPFIPINCGAVPSELLESELFGHKKGAFTGAVRDHVGIFQKAQSGTLFLDEIGDMPLPLQVKLLRVLQERSIRPVGSNEEISIEVQIVSATHRDLQSEIENKTFREDLFYRLNVVNLELPALRQRREDIPLLANYFVELVCQRNNTPEVRLSSDAVQCLVEHHWPGNIRELQNLIEQVVALNHGEMISAAQISTALKIDNNDIILDSLSEAKRQFERDYVIEKLKITQGNVAEAAKLAGRNRSDFYKLIKKHGIELES